MTDIRITDYDISMTDQVRRLFVGIYPDQPDLVKKMCYDPARPDHVATKVAFLGKDIVGQANIFLHKALNGNANLGFHVHPSARKRGIATHLSSEALKDAGAIGIKLCYIRTHVENFAAIAVAHSLDFIRDDSLFAEEGLAVFTKRL